VEDWEEFFVEKSRRRAEKERLGRRRRRTARLLTFLIIGLMIAGGIVGLALQR